MNNSCSNCLIGENFIIIPISEGNECFNSPKSDLDFILIFKSYSDFDSCYELNMFGNMATPIRNSIHFDSNSNHRLNAPLVCFTCQQPPFMIENSPNHHPTSWELTTRECRLAWCPPPTTINIPTNGKLSIPLVGL